MSKYDFDDIICDGEEFETDDFVQKTMNQSLESIKESRKSLFEEVDRRIDKKIEKALRKEKS